MPRVALLPDVLVNQIAAGEVIERPASVVKELVENSLDAGARSVEVAIDGGGIDRIEVRDDGHGMLPEDARMALYRHATSKIATVDDLSTFMTLGFRGEALPSIASVSRLVLRTSPDSSGLGTEVLADRGADPRATPVSHPRGTHITVEDLFGNVPARRKFLKSADGETRAVVRLLTTLALSRPGVAFTLRSGDRTLLSLPAARDAAGRFLEVLGGDRALPVTFSAGNLSLAGSVTAPARTYPTRVNQWLFVNGRAAKDTSVTYAAQNAAREALGTDRHPGWALFLSMDPGLVDVNVHPQKLEVRFREPGAVSSLVYHGLVEALLAAKSADAVPVESLAARTYMVRPSPEPVFVSEAPATWGGRDLQPDQPTLLPAPRVSVARETYPESREVASPLGPLRLLGQYRASFLLAEGPDGLVVIDQHVAHERVRYERIRRRLLAGTTPSQQLLLPVAFEATAAEAATLRLSDDLLAEAGFVVSEQSGRTFVVSAAPSDCAPGAVVPFLRDLLSKLDALPDGAGRDTSRKDALAASLACRGAITINTPLPHEEAARLLRDLAECEDPWTCPHGRPILLTFAHAELTRRFHRS
ncbi:MAG: DNA mismatch repair endonuclease MutL [Acidobacteria bacterium]|nr:DNA mismatch repair endonuclease MutL [Acidobacteriota bacterium]